MRIAIVVPRYGRDVGGGAETLARDYATRLAARMDVTVLTTCAREYRTWEDHYPAGEYLEDGVRILRFPVPKPRNGSAFDACSSTVLGGPQPSAELEQQWMEAQGPNAPGLLAHLEAAGRSYDAVVFIPYLYATTVRGLPIVADRSVLVPAFHDEPPLRLAVFDEVVAKSQAVVFSTPEEHELAQRRFGVDSARCHFAGAGIDAPPVGDADRFRARFGVERPYALCLGRIDPSKGSDVLVSNHREYRKRRPQGLDLVMVGPAVDEPPREPWLHTPGYVTEEQKHDAISGAVALVCPSPYESLSLVLLEAWSHGVPTIVTSASPVLLGQTRRAGGGVWYRDPLEYAACLDLLATRPPLAHALGRAGWKFTRDLSWPVVIGRLEDAIRQAADLPPLPQAPVTSEPAGGPGDMDRAMRLRRDEPGPLQVACRGHDAFAMALVLNASAPGSQLYVVTDDPRAMLPPGAVAIRRQAAESDSWLAAIDVVVDDDRDPEFGQVARRSGAVVAGADAAEFAAAIRAALSERQAG